MKQPMTSMIIIVESSRRNFSDSNGITMYWAAIPITPTSCCCKCCVVSDIPVEFSSEVQVLIATISCTHIDKLLHVKTEDHKKYVDTKIILPFVEHRPRSKAILLHSVLPKFSVRSPHLSETKYIAALDFYV